MQLIRQAVKIEGTELETMDSTHLSEWSRQEDRCQASLSDKGMDKEEMRELKKIKKEKKCSGLTPYSLKKTRSRECSHPRQSLAKNPAQT